MCSVNPTSCLLLFTLLLCLNDVHAFAVAPKQNHQKLMVPESQPPLTPLVSTTSVSFPIVSGDGLTSADSWDHFRSTIDRSSSCVLNSNPEKDSKFSQRNGGSGAGLTAAFSPTIDLSSCALKEDDSKFSQRMSALKGGCEVAWGCLLRVLDFGTTKLVALLAALPAATDAASSATTTFAAGSVMATILTELVDLVKSLTLLAIVLGTLCKKDKDEDDVIKDQIDEQRHMIDGLSHQLQAFQQDLTSSAERQPALSIVPWWNNQHQQQDNLQQTAAVLSSNIDGLRRKNQEVMRTMERQDNKKYPSILDFVTELCGNEINLEQCMPSRTL